MAGQVRSLTALPSPVPRFIQRTYATSTAYPIGISADRAKIFGAYSGASGSAASAKLYESANNGTSWTEVHAFATGENVVAFLETGDGEALVSTTTNLTASGVARLYKSSGWEASHSAATWTLVLTGVGEFREGWHLHQWSYGNDDIRPASSQFGIIGEYGTTGSATRIWITDDYGATWTLALNLASRYPALTSYLHVHATAYDVYDDRMIVVYGDPPVGSNPGESELLICDNWRDALDGGSFTWTAHPADDRYHSTTIAVMEDCILLGADSFNGITRISRLGYRSYGHPQTAMVVQPHNSAGVIAMGAYRAPDINGAPLLMGTITEGTASGYAPQILGTTDGLSFAEFWRDESLINVAGSPGPRSTFGPTTDGVYVSRVKQNTADDGYKLLVGEVIPADDLGAISASDVSASTSSEFPGLKIMDGLQPVSPSSSMNRALSSGLLASNVRMPIELPEAIKTIRLLFGNWYVGFSNPITAEAANGSALLKVSASIEKPSGAIVRILDSAPCPSDQNLVSPEIDCVCNPVDGTHYLRLYVEVASTAAAFPLGFAPLNTTWVNYTSAPTDQTGVSGALSATGGTAGTATGLGTSANFQAFGPQIIAGQGATRRKKVIVAVGDHVVNGSWDTDPARGFVNRALTPKGISALRISRGNTMLNDFTSASRHARRMKLIDGATDAIVLAGTQGLADGSLAALSLLQAGFTAIATELQGAGLRVAGCTIPPYVGLTTSPSGGQAKVRADFNDWVRAGADGASVELIETAGSVEVSANSNTWVAGANYSDNTIPDVDGHTLMAVPLAASTLATSYTTASAV